MKQQILFSDIKKDIHELRHDMKVKLSEYQKDLIAVEKEVQLAEKKACKSRENVEKLLEIRDKYVNVCKSHFVNSRKLAAVADFVYFLLYLEIVEMKI